MDETSFEEREALAFLDDLFGRSERTDLLIQLWKKETKKSAYIATVPAAAVYAVKTIKRDAYVCVSLVQKDLGSGRRGTAKDAVCIPGFWADIDVNGGPEGKTNAAPTIEHAETIARSVLEPTILVNSGYGLQAWYLFDEPLLFHTAEERDRAAAYAHGWNIRLRKEATAAGFTIDSTHDLARLMRMPGTVNAKGGLSAPVTGYGAPVFEQDGPRYSIEAFAEHCKPVAAMNNGHRPSVEIGAISHETRDRLEVLRENNERFNDTWKRERRDKIARDWSPSEYCLSIASFCVHADFTDQQIAETLVLYRKKHGDNDKHQGFYELTINRARSSVIESRRDEERRDAVDELAIIADDEDPADPDRVTHLFSKLIGGGFNVKELVKSNDDPSTAVYRLIMDDGLVIPIGSFENLDDPNRFARQFVVRANYRPPLVKKSEWIGALNAILKTCVERQADTTMESQVLGWLRRYLAAMITADHNEAAARRDPFERGGHIWIAPRSFHDYISRALRKTISLSTLEEQLDLLGFERHIKNFRDPDTESGQNTTREYLRIPKNQIEERIDEATEGEDEKYD